MRTLNQYATVTRQHIRELGRITITATSADNPTLKLSVHFIEWCGEGVASVSAHCNLHCKGRRKTGYLVNVVLLHVSFKLLERQINIIVHDLLY